MSEQIHHGKVYTVAEEIVNSVTHGIGAVLSVVALVILIIYSSALGDPWKIVGLSIYGASMVLLYLASTLYHSFRSPRLKTLFKMVDHCAIYLLIAGTYTPFLLVNMRGPTGWWLLGIVWTLALIGIFLKLVYPTRFRKVRLLNYVAMGWLIVSSGSELSAALGETGLTLVAAGGITYTLGIIFYLWEKLPFNHGIWHLFVMGGSGCHFAAMLAAVIPHGTALS